MEEANLGQLFSRTGTITEKTTNEVLEMAREIRAIWAAYGQAGVADYLQESFGLSAEQAQKIAQYYQPQHDILPLDLADAQKRNLKSSQIFDEICLQVPGFWPKNILAWLVLREVHGEDSFNFDISGKSSQQHDNKIDFPALLCDEKGNVPRFGFAALGATNLSNLAAHVIKKSLFFQERLGKEMGLDLTQALLKADVIFPPPKLVTMLCEAIERGLAGETVILTSIICPDYSYEETGDSKVPYRYNFNTVNEGVGLVAQQVARVLPFLTQFLERYKISYKVIISIADFEANDQQVLSRVKMSKEQFVQRCQASLHSFQTMLPDIPMELHLFEKELAKSFWWSVKASAFKDLSGDLAQNIRQATGKDVKSQVNFIAKANHKFYIDWSGREVSLAESEIMVFEQGSEYSAAAKIIAESYPNQPIIQIAGDRPKMQIFNYLYVRIPTLCTKRVY